MIYVDICGAYKNISPSERSAGRCGDDDGGRQRDTWVSYLCFIPRHSNNMTSLPVFSTYSQGQVLLSKQNLFTFPSAPRPVEGEQRSASTLSDRTASLVSILSKDTSIKISK